MVWYVNYISVKLLKNKKQFGVRSWDTWHSGWDLLPLMGGEAWMRCKGRCWEEAGHALFLGADDTDTLSFENSTSWTHVMTPMVLYVHGHTFLYIKPNESF